MAAQYLCKLRIAYLPACVCAGGRGFGAEDFWCRDFSDNTNLDIYLLLTVQWVNGKSVLDLFLKPFPMPKIFYHHILIFLVTFASICCCRRVAGVQAGNIALLEF